VQTYISREMRRDLLVFLELKAEDCVWLLLCHLIERRNCLGVTD